MKKVPFLLLALNLLAVPFIPAQDLRLPRNPDRLVERAQRFWNAVASGQRLEALQFILPEKKNLFLSGNPVPVLKAKVMGLDLTADPTQATVRIGLDVLSAGTQAGRLNWTIADPWIWRGDNWYVNLQDPAGIIPKGESFDPIDPRQFQAQIDKSFEVLQDPVDFGTLTAGAHIQIEVPIRYTGDLPISIDLALPNPLVSLGIAGVITSKSKNLVLLVGTEDWEGPFNFPLPLKISHGGVSSERTLLVKGEVFVPLAFRQSPPNGPIEVGREFSVFIRNNTDQEAAVRYLATDAKLDVVKQPSMLPPKQEVELVLKLRPGQSPDVFYINLDSPLSGRDTYTYRIRNVRP